MTRFYDPKHVDLIHSEHLMIVIGGKECLTVASLLDGGSPKCKGFPQGDLAETRVMGEHMIFPRRSGGNTSHG